MSNCYQEEWDRFTQSVRLKSLHDAFQQTQKIVEKPVTKFHKYMNEMTIEVEKEFTRDDVAFIRGRDKKNRSFVVPKAWLSKEYLKANRPMEPIPGSVVFAKDKTTGAETTYVRIKDPNTVFCWRTFGSSSHLSWSYITRWNDITKVIPA